MSNLSQKLAIAAVALPALALSANTVAQTTTPAPQTPRDLCNTFANANDGKNMRTFMSGVSMGTDGRIGCEYDRDSRFVKFYDMANRTDKSQFERRYAQLDRQEEAQIRREEARAAAEERRRAADPLGDVNRTIEGANRTVQRVCNFAGMKLCN